MTWSLPLLGALLLLVVCGGPPPGPEPVTLAFKHAKILGPADPLPGLLRAFEARHTPATPASASSESRPWSPDE